MPPASQINLYVNETADISVAIMFRMYCLNLNGRRMKLLKIGWRVFYKNYSLQKFIYIKRVYEI